MKHCRLISTGVAAVCMGLSITGSSWSSGIVTHQLVVKKVASPPVMDGRLDDPAWVKAPEASGFTVVGFKGRKADNPTFVKAVTDGKAVYFGFRCVEPKVADIPIISTKHDSDTWLQDSVEVFLNPDGNREVSYHIIANISGGGYESRLTRTAQGLLDENSAWNGDMAVSSSKGNGEWYAEVKIPYSTFGIDPAKSPVAGVNFNRNRLQGGGELSCWSPNRVTFPEITDLGDLIFSDTQVVFPEPVSITTADSEMPFEIYNHSNSTSNPKLVFEFTGPNPGSGDSSINKPLPPGKKFTGSLPGYMGKGSYKLHAKLIDSKSRKILFNVYRDLEVTDPIVFDEELYALYHKRVDAEVDVRVPAGSKDLRVALMREGSETPVAVQVFNRPFSAPIKVSFSLADQLQGTYKLRAELFDRNSSSMQSESRNYVYKPNPKVGFNEDGFMLVDGKPFFPVGIYSLHTKDVKIDDNIMKEAKAAGFNCTIFYPQKPEMLMPLLDGIDRYGFKAFVYPTVPFQDRYGEVLPETEKKDIDVRRNHPALIGWYVTDEPEALGNVPPKPVRDLYQLIKEYDPDHPCISVIMSPEAAKGYRSATDIVGLDPYPVPKQPVTIISDFVKRSVENVEADKPVWDIPQAFDWSMWNEGKIVGEHRPNAAEEKCLTYLALVNGSKAIIYWAFTGSKYLITDYPDHWAAVKKVASEVHDLSPVLVTRTVSGKLSVAPKDTPIQTMVKRMDGVWYVLAVNSSRDQATANFNLSETEGSDMDVLFENRKIQAKGGKWNDEFKPLEVHVYKIASK